jgi:hypothetical protein
MGRLLKNTVFKSGSYTLGIPTGTSSVGPDSAVPGQTRFNTTTGKLEFYDDGAWQAFAREGSATITKDTFTGDNVNSVFGPMSFSYSASQEAQVLVFLNTVFQNPGVNYTFDGTTNITFTSIPPSSATIVLLHGFSSTTVG